MIVTPVSEGLLSSALIQHTQNEESGENEVRGEGASEGGLWPFVHHVLVTCIRE